MKKKLISLLLVTIIMLQVTTPVVLGVEEAIIEEQQEVVNEEQEVVEQEQQEVQLLTEQQSTESANITFKDNKIKQKLIELGYDTNGDNEISNSETELISYLYFYERAEFDYLDDLEYLTNLKELGICNMADSELDISAISKLTSLTGLIIQSNTVEFGDFSILKNLTNLEKLEINKSGATTTLDLTGLGEYTNIKNLNIAGKFENLDEIKKLVNLENLWIYGSDSEVEIDASILTGLSKLNILYLSGNIANFEKIFENTNIKDLNIYPYYGDGTIDLSGIENLTQLTSLSISGNIVGLENIQKLSNLTYLSISCANYNATNDAKDMFDIVSKMNIKNMDYLYCYAMQKLGTFEKGTEAKLSFEELGGFIKSMTTSGETLYDANYDIYNYEDSDAIIDTENKQITFNTETVGEKYSSIYINTENINININMYWDVELTGDTETEINIPDENFKQYLLNNHDIDGNGKITEHDMINLQTLELGGANVTSLEGLEYAENLQLLSVYYPCTNISAVSKLTNLESLSIYTNIEIDCNLFKDLDKLRYLNIYNANIKNVDQLKELQGLVSISLNYLESTLTDLSFVSGCTNLETLYCMNNRIADITALENLENLRYVNLTGNPIDDQEENNARVLEKLEKNGVTVEISEFDRTENITFKDEKFKQVLIDQGNDLNKDDEISEYEMEQIISLYSYTDQITCIDEITYAKNIRYLELNYLDTTNFDFTPISKLTNLEELGISSSYDSEGNIDISFIDNLTNLKKLKISSNVTDINKIYKNTKISELVIENTYAMDTPIELTGIENMTNLSKLTIRGYLENIEAISKLTNLKELTIGNYGSFDSNKIFELVGNLELDVLNLTGSYTEDIGNYKQGEKAEISFEDVSPILKSITTEGGILYDENAAISSYSYERITIDTENKKIILNTDEIGKQQAGFGINYTIKVSDSQIYNNNVTINLEWTTYTEGENETEINIPDTNLKQYLLEEYDIDEDGKITEHDLINIGYIDIRNKNVSSLVGLEKAVNLTELYAIYNNITDITPILNLENLKYINLSHNMLTDISAITNAKWNINNPEDYSYVDLEYNFIDFTEGNKNYNALKSLELDNFEYIINCQNYGTVDKINETVDLEQNIKTKLIEYGVDINSDNKISRKELYWIEEALYANEIYELDLSECNITNLSGLEYLNLYDLNLSGNNITDITPLTKINSLYYLNLSDNKIQNISGIGDCYSLEYIVLNDNQITDITPLSKLNSLSKEFDYEDGAMSMTYIELNNNNIKDISSIKNWKNYWELYLANNKIQDISALKDYQFIDGMEDWYTLDLENNNIDIESSGNKKAIEHFEQSGAYIYYENQTVLPKDDTYIGNINSELITFNVGKNDSGATYVSGQIVVVEWIDGKSTVPTVAPKMKFKSTDGKVELEVFVTPTGTNTYYFDRFIEGINTDKEYFFEIESGNENNVSEYRSMNVYFTNTKYNNTIVGYYKDQKIRLLKQNIIFEPDTYVGNINSELITFNVGQNSSGATYVSGQVVVVEWVNGVSTVPKVAPKMKFKSTDGTVELEVFVTPTGTNTYYFDRFIEGINTEKEYFFEIESGDSRNVSESRSMNVYFTGTKYNNTIVGYYKDQKIRLLKQNIIFEPDTYVGNINSELITFNVGQNSSGATYVSGQVVVVEWVDGVSTVPKVAPKMKFKSTDGTVELEVFVTPTGTNTYYFDRFIEGINTDKEYFFEIESGDSRNVSENKSMNVYFTKTQYNDKIVGKYDGFDIRLLKQNIIFE